jgi:hypothetical protein
MRRTDTIRRNDAVSFAPGALRHRQRGREAKKNGNQENGHHKSDAGPAVTSSHVSYRTRSGPIGSRWNTFPRNVAPFME